MAAIKVTLKKDGSLLIDAQGFRGPHCAEATRTLEAALGQVTEREDKPEMYAQEITEELQQ